MTDLFANAGLSLASVKKDGPARKAFARTPLFAPKIVEDARVKAHAAFQPTKAQIEAAHDYARKAKKSFGKLKEEAVRPTFFSQILQTVLGYQTADPEAAYSLAFERPIRRGKVDVALGRFDDGEGVEDILAPFELKGPATEDLDAPMPGRGRSPVQQAWDYAIDAPGARFVLVSNCLEIRLYGFGRGRDAYETFDLRRLDDPAEHERLWLILSASRFLTGGADALLAATDTAYKDVTERLYTDYKGLRDRLIAYLVDSADGPNLDALVAIQTSQKLLDRVLFIAFAQGTDLLPDRLLERAAKSRNEFNPEPIWRNFATLFRAVDKGATHLQIWPYNGGLFADDPVADRLELPDFLASDIADLGKWDYRREVPVTVLGHIFEQSITDIEKRKAEARGEAAPAVSKRKREGVVYTPDMVTRFLVERTIGETLREIFDAAWARRGMGESADEATQLAFWSDYLAALRALTIVDPACGSGAFLVAAFDALVREYQRAQAALLALGAGLDFDIFDYIVSKNLYGVDLNAESVEIARLSLWLKTARPDHRLQNLEATIRVGDSLIEDAAFSPRAFDWRASFPDVFAGGGFDIVIGNPPYVRMELIKAIKPYLEEHYAVASDRADLYAYFFERGARLLKRGGRLGFISSSTFFRTGSGAPLRTFLTDGLALETVVDFGDAQIFGGVTTYPAILTLRREEEAAGDLSFLVIKGDAPKELGRTFREFAHIMPRGRLGAGSWRFEDDALARLREKIATGRKTLGEVYGAPLYGIKTGLNDAFVIDTPTRDRLIAADSRSADLLRPFLRGEDIKRWRVEPQGWWLINTPRGKVDIEKYPAIRDWLLPFRAALEKRATKQDWWELQQAQLAYQPRFASQKIIYGHFAKERIFSIDRSGSYSNDKTYFVPDADFALLSSLNSRVIWFLLTGLAPAVRDGWRELRVQYVETLPIPVFRVADRKRLAALGELCSDKAYERFKIAAEVQHRILDLAPPNRVALTSKLENWPSLDFPTFLAEIKRTFRVEIPLKQRAEWQAFLDENRAAVRKLTAEIADAEREIDSVVYGLFDLTTDEIALIEKSLAGQN